MKKKQTSSSPSMVKLGRRRKKKKFNSEIKNYSFIVNKKNCKSKV